MRAILTYHSIDHSGSPISVDSASFRRHARWLASGRVRVVSLAELVRLPADSEAVAITFDDGFANFGDIAAPVLKDLALPATLFVVSDHVGGTNAWGGQAAPGIPTLRLLDWNRLGRLVEMGVELGGHTKTHPRLTELAPDRLEDELAGSAARIRSETGRVPKSVAYPYGVLDPVVVEAAGKVYQYGCTTDLRVLRHAESALKLPRLDMYYFREARRLEAWGTAGFKRRLWVQAQARRLRQSLAPIGGVR